MGLIVVDVGHLTDPDATTVDLLARLQLVARRLGCEVALASSPPRLQELLDLFGLPVEVVGQAEQREHPLGVQEEADAADRAV